MPRRSPAKPGCTNSVGNRQTVWAPECSDFSIKLPGNPAFPRDACVAGRVDLHSGHATAMKTTAVRLLTVLLLCLLFPLSSPALMSIGPLDRAAAKQWGIELRITENGPENAWVELTFEPSGKLEHFAHVSMELEDGGKLLLGYTPLKDYKRNGKVVVGFMAGRAILDKITLRIVTGDPGNYSGNDLAVKDFLPVQTAK